MIHRAIRNEDQEYARTRWSDALSVSGYRQSFGGTRFGNRLVPRQAVVATRSDVVFRRISRIGGVNGWYFGNWLWSLRGFVDLLFGGVGLRRGRRDPES